MKQEEEEQQQVGEEEEKEEEGSLMELDEKEAEVFSNESTRKLLRFGRCFRTSRSALSHLN